jgi:hypothetical protein
MKRFALLLAIAACTKAAPPPGSAGPSEAVQDFAAALQRQDPQAAWALLSSKTQADANKMSPTGDGRAMLFSSALPGAPLTVASVQQSGDSADVRTALPDGGAGATYRAVSESGRWRVDLEIKR